MGGIGSGEVDMSVAICDVDQSEISKVFIKTIQDKNPKVKILNVTREQAIEQIRRARVTGAIVIPKGFGERAGIFWKEPPTLEIAVDPSKTAEAGMLQGMVMQSIGEIVGTRFKDPTSLRPYIEEAKKSVQSEEGNLATKLLVGQLFNSLDDLLNKVNEVNREQAKDGEGGGPSFEFVKIEKLDIRRSQNEVFTKLRSKWDLSFPQAILWGVLGTVASFAISIVKERSAGTYTRLLVAPIPKMQIVAGKGLACGLAVLAVCVVLLGLGISLGLRPQNYLMLAVASVSVAGCFVGIMMLMASIGRTEQAVSGAGWGINVFMSMFGGGMIPLAFMPPFMKMLSAVSPVTWAIYCLEGAIWRELSWSDMAWPLTVLWLIGGVCFALGVVALRRTDSQA